MFAYDAKIVNGWVCPEGFQYKFVQILAWLVKEGGILSSGYRCGAGHKVSKGKVSEWSSKKREFSNESKMISVYVPCLGFDRSYK